MDQRIVTFDLLNFGIRNLRLEQLQQCIAKVSVLRGWQWVTLRLRKNSSRRLAGIVFVCREISRSQARQSLAFFHFVQLVSVVAVRWMSHLVKLLQHSNVPYGLIPSGLLIVARRRGLLRPIRHPTRGDPYGVRKNDSQARHQLNQSGVQVARGL